MADVNANIGVSIDTSEALAQLKALQRQISQFHSSIARSSESAAIAQKSLQKNLLGSINSIGAFSAELRTVRTSAESFTNSLEKNKFSMREYFRYAGASTKTFGRLFRSEFDTIGKVAEERVKTLQTQYIKMGRNASGAMEAIAVRPTALNMQDYGTRTAIAAQKQALFNQLMKQGTTNLLNFGKNTQWAGRQLMVGFTIPLSIVGSTATKTFMDMEAQALKFRKVYGDLFTPKAETQQALDDVTELGRQFTKYGVAVSTTVGLAAEAAAAGFQGLDLQRQTTEATRLSILGQIDSQKALETTISLQNAFGMSSESLADSINFLNAVENQTVVSLDDITTAIPKVAPVIQQLGGDVKDLTFFIAALKEGGINASEGANALKSGLAALINPTKKASDMLASFGINATAIVEKNKGDLKATVVDFAEALNALDPLARARAIEQMFGKFQFARLSTLFANVARDGNQASRVLDLANASVEELSSLSEQELGMTADSAMNRFRKSVEDLKFALIPVGQAFLEAATPIVEFVGGVLEKFGNLSDGTKRLITVLTVAVGAIGPIFLMTFGLLANALANAMKGAMILRQGYLRLTGQSQILGEQTQYLNTEQLEAAAAAHSLDQSHAKLTQQFTAETAALQQLIAAYQSATRAGNAFMLNNPGMMLPPRGGRKLASGIVSVPGPKGAGDIVPAMLSPGEAVIPSKMAQKYAPLINGMIADNIPGFKDGLPLGDIKKSLGLFRAPYAVAKQTGAMSWETLPAELAAVEQTASQILNATVSDVQKVNEKLGNLKRKQASHIVPDVTSMMVGKEQVNIKNWMASNLQADLGYVNAYVNTIQQSNTIVENFNKQHIDKAAQTLNMSVQEVAEELNKLKQGIHPTTRRSAQVLQQVGMTDPGYQGQAAAAGLGVRLSGNYYETLGSRTYDPAKDINAAKTVERKVAKLEKQVINRSQSLAQMAISKTAQAAGTESPSKKTIRIGQDIARGLEVGMADRQDDVAKAGTNLSNAAVGGTQRGRRVATRPQGAPVPLGMVAANAPMSPEINNKVKEQARNIQQSNQRLTSFNNKLMGGTFALTSIAGIASMAGGNLGKLSSIVFQLSGVAFALSTILNILPNKFKTFLFALKPGPALAFTAALAAGVGIIKLINNAREKERMAIEGVGRAANLTSKQIEKLGGILNFTPVKSNLEFAKPQVSGLSPVQSQQVEQLTKTLKEDKEFQNQVKGLSAATKEQAELIFKSLSIRLAGQGATKEAIQNYIYALQQEAGRLDVSFNVNSIDLTTKEGQAGLKDAATKLVNDFNFAFAKGYKTTKVRSMATGEIVEIGEASDELKQKLFSASQVFSSFFMGIETQLTTGKINADQFTESFNQISNSIKQMPKAQGMMVLSEMLKTMPSEIAKAAANIKDMDTQFRVLEATMLGVYITQEMLDQLLIKSTEGGAQRAQGRVNAYLNRAIAKAKLAKETLAKLIGTETGTGTGQKETARQIADKNLSTINNFFNAQEALLRQNRKSQADLYQAQIDTAQGAIDAAQKRIDAEQSVIDTNQRSIDLLNRRIELEFDRPIQKLQDESAILNNNLDIIRRQEGAINDQYDKQIQALEKISSVNQEIANQEKSRLTIADALTSGDIAAAAAAVQDARAQAAASRIDQQTKALETSRQQALAGVTAGGMTKDQIEARTYQIGQQTFLLEQQRKTLQNDITTLQDKNYLIEQKIYDIKQASIVPNQKIVDDTKQILDNYNKTTDSLVNGIKYLGKTQTEWDAVKVRVEAANSAIDLTEVGLKKASALTSQIFKDWDAIKNKTITITTNYVTGTTSAPLLDPTKATPTVKTSTSTSFFDKFKMYGGKIKPMNMGGVVPKYFAAGGRMGSDTVPAMLTPGEFVINKKASQEFGPLLSMLNESKYPSMIGSSYNGQGAGIGAVTSVNDNSRSVYNYNVGINVPQSNANPNDIARAVIGQIKYIDNQRIRGQR
jgi:TP901 family phage tail tape measure protein